VQPTDYEQAILQYAADGTRTAAEVIQELKVAFPEHLTEIRAAYQKLRSERRILIHKKTQYVIAF
jgi:hypothetical protein